MIQENRNLKDNKSDLMLKLQRIVIGRDKEIEAIKMQFDTVLEGQSAVTIIAGDIGVGKTDLVKTALIDMSKMNATYAYGKFEQYKDEEPYIALIQIVQNIANNMLTLPKNELKQLSKKLVKAIGKDCALITEIVPQMETIIGKQKKINITDYQKLKIRLERAFQMLIKIAAKELYPLILFIDDLQWADKSSLDIIKSIQDNLSEFELYIIFAYRNNKEEYKNKIKSIINEFENRNLLEIDLQNISCEAIKEIAMNVFDKGIDNVDKLSQLVYRKTMGNPLYIKQMLNFLIDNKGIYYDFNQQIWCFEPTHIHSYKFLMGVEDIINRKIDSLTPQTKKLLEIVACIGSRFSIEQLKKIIPDEDTIIEKRLEDLCNAGLIIEITENFNDNQEREFEFLHDRINQIVYEQICIDRREQLHFDIAMHLMHNSDRIYIEDHSLTITAHLLNCKNIILREKVQDELIIDLYYAGVKAKQSAAIEHALKLFTLCEELLDKPCWQKDYQNTLKIKLNLAECEFICGLYDLSKIHFDEMLSQALNKEDLSEIKKRYMILNSYIGNYSEVLDLGIQALKDIGVHIDLKKVKFQIVKEILHSKILYRNSRLNTIKNAPIINNKTVVSALEILNIMAASANITNEDLFSLIVLKIGNVSAKYGNSLYSPVGYAAYSLVLGSVLGDYKKAKEIQDIALTLAEIIDDNALKCAAYFIIGTFIDHWTSPAEKTFHILEKSFNCGVQSGEFFYSGFTITTMIEMKYSMGKPLNELDEFLKLNEKYGQKMNHKILLRLIRIFKDHIRCLTSSDDLLKDQLINNEEVASLETNEVMTYYLLKLQRLYFAGKIDEAYDLSQITIKQLDSVMGYFLQVDFVFYFLLLNLEKMKKQKTSTYKYNKRIFEKYRKKLKIWAEMSPENHKGKHLLIEALCRSLNHKEKADISLFDDAIEHAKENNNLLLEAIGNYLAADYYSKNKRIAKIYAEDAYDLFNKWGAPKTASWIDMLYSINDTVTSQVRTTSMEKEVVDNYEKEKNITFQKKVIDYRKELESFDLEKAFTYFLDTICKESKADYGGIFLEKNDQINLRYVRQDGKKSTSCQEGVDIEQVSGISKKVIRYASRTYEEVIIEAKPIEGVFGSDDYIRNMDSISIICLPLKYKGVFMGLIYLESQSNHGFDPTIVKFINELSFYLIAKQALEKESDHKAKIFINDTVRDELTNREAEVLYYIAEGMTNKKIGEKLGISSGTVKTHTLNLYKKLEVNCRVQAVSTAKKLELI